MLILTRRVGETVMIGDDVTITVLGVKGNQVRVGINAPKHVAVHREEIYERIKREQQGGGPESGRSRGGESPDDPDKKTAKAAQSPSRPSDNPVAATARATALRAAARPVAPPRRRAPAGDRSSRTAP